MTDSPILRLGTRGSLLACSQSEMIAAALRSRHPGLIVETIVLRTSGDQITDRPLSDLGGKGLFTKELEQALLAGSIDFAVHSFKDVPVTMPLVDTSDLLIAAVPAREDARDVLVSAKANSIAGLPSAARVGTGSLRRRAEILERRPDLTVQNIRGNIDTRLRKCRDGEFDAIVLAAAGLNRAGLFDPAIMFPLDPEQSLPAPAQGALALQCRRSDPLTRKTLSILNDPPTAACVAAEREIVRLLKGDCHSPIGAYAVVREDGLFLRAAVARRGGQPPILRESSVGNANGPADISRGVFHRLEARGALKLLHDEQE